MKPGSIVVIRPFQLRSDLIPFIQWVPKDDEKTPYMVRDISVHEGQVGVTLEEGCIGFHPINKLELNIAIELLIELLPPDPISIESIIEETNLQPA